MDYITFKHSFNAGDLITVLPGIKHICDKNRTKAIVYQRLNLPSDYGHSDPHPIVHAGRQVCMNLEIFRMIKPLIESQDYIERFEVWEGQDVQFDYDKTRHNSQMPLPGGSIHKWPSLIYPQLECDLCAPWLLDEYAYHRKAIDKDQPICINMTQRYRNPYISYFFLKEYSNECLFLGTPDEWALFNEQWGLKIPYRSVADFLDLANVIMHCRLFIGNQSLCWHIADAMKVPRILEVCTQYPNTFPTGKNGYSFITQEALEFRFHKLLNENNG